MAIIKNPLIVISSDIASTTYVRPADWLPIPEIDGTKDEIYILNGVALNGVDKIYFKIKGAGTIDWGDGNIENFNATKIQEFEHTFNYDSLADSSYTTHNDTKQVLIHISAERGVITYFSTGNITYKYTDEDGNIHNYSNSMSTNIYQISADVENCEVQFGSSSSYIKHEKLEICDWKGLITNTNRAMSYTFGYCSALQLIPQLNTSNVISMGSTFYSCTSLKTIPQLDTSNVKYMDSIFAGCNSLESIPQLDTSKVTNMSSMFSNCSKLKTIPLLDTSKVTSMTQMFINCDKLKTIPQLDTSNVTSMFAMFSGCNSLESIPQLDTSKVTDMGSMFSSCSKLKTIPQLDTSNATKMGSMFYRCHSLKTIPQLDTSKVTSIGYMFSENYYLYNLRLYNAGATSQTSLTIDSFNYGCYFMKKQQLIDLFNSVCPNSVSGNTRKLQLGSTLQGYLSECYVKDSGELYTAILPTSDTTVQNEKTYYTYDETTGEYTQFTGTEFVANTFYYELKTATWNRFDICESTDTGAKLALTWFTEDKGWTVA